MSDLALGVTIGAAFAAGWKSIIGNAQTDLSKLGREIKQVSAQERNAKVLGSLPGELDATRIRLQAAREQTDHLRLAATLAGTSQTKAAREARKEWRVAERGIKAIERELDQQVKEWQRVDAAMQKAGHNTDELDKVSASLRTQNIELNRQRELLEQRRSAQNAMKGEWAKIGAFVGLSVKATSSAIAFESVMADVRKVVDFDSPKQFAEMGSDIRRMSQWLGLSAEEIGNIVAAGGQSNIAREDLLAFAEDAGKMGVAFDIAADEAGQMMAQWRAGLELTQEEVRALADQINHLGNTGPASAAKISSIVTRIGALGDVAGLNGSAIAALGSTITGVGISEEVAATGIKNLMLTLTQGTAATNKQKSALRALGLDAEDMAIRMQEDAQGAIVELLGALKDLDKEQQASTLTQLFGRESVAAIAPLLKNLNVLEDNFRKVSDAAEYTGSMQQEFDSRMDTAGQRLKNLGSTLKNTAIIIGNVFLPPLNLMVGLFTSVLKGVNVLAETFPLLTAVVVGATVAWLTWNTAVAASQFALTFMPKSITSLTSRLLTFIPVTSLSSAALTAFATAATLVNVALWPITALVGAVALGGFLIYKYWQPLKAFFGGLFSGLWSGIEPLRTAFTDAFAPLAPMFSTLGNGIRPVINWFKELFSPVNATGEELAQVASMGQRVGEVVGKAFTIITAPLQAALQLIGAILAAYQKAVDMGKAAARFFGFGGNDAEGAVQEEVEKTIQQAVERSPASSAGRPSVQQTNHTEAPIHIYPAPGQSAEEIGEVVARKLAELQQRNEARRRSALYDV